MNEVLKIGGNQLDDPAFVAGMAAAVRSMVANGSVPVIVHGGGKAIGRLQAAFGIPTVKIGGLRVTDDETMNLVAMALCGAANLSLVAALTNAGVEAEGFNGADRGLMRSAKLTHPDGDLGRVGRVTAVRADVLRGVLAAGIVPVIAPVALAEDGGFHNINADQAAGAVAAAIGAGRVTFLTDVPGVLVNGVPVPRLRQAEAEALIANGTARDGMAVKLGAALDALSGGVATALITNLEGLEAHVGTELVK
jgi:acetylglutamate kinase